MPDHTRYIVRSFAHLDRGDDWPECWYANASGSLDDAIIAADISVKGSFPT